jgi:hypothetical protein
LGRVGFGAFAQDIEGHVLAAWSTTISTSIYSTMAEAWAALHAVIFINEIRKFDIILEGDIEVVKANNSDS